mmetsp:Transcript_15613/g.19042  ORF Transcript_15613/g.19042 Transcript_15613/m.19042 type:complete len:110 (+) Transcript_15613:111-440(+)
MPRIALPDLDKQLNFKTKAAQRLAKEVAYYEKEVKENEEKLARMKADGKDPYDIKKFEEVLGESHMMIPDSQNRYKKTLDDLKEFMTTHEDEFNNDEYVVAAKALVGSA